MNVARSRGQVEHKIVEVAPRGIGDELFQRVAGHSAPPHDGTLGIYKEAYREELYAVFLHREDKIASVDILGIGTGIFDIEHLGHRRTENIGIEQAHLVTLASQGDSQIGRDGRFAHTAFSRRDRNDVLDLRQELPGRRRLRLTALDPYVTFDVDLLAHISENGGLGRFHHRLLERVVGPLENERERDLVALDANVVFDHAGRNEVFPVTGITHRSQCVENQFWIYCHIR